MPFVQDSSLDRFRAYLTLEQRLRQNRFGRLLPLPPIT